MSVQIAVACVTCGACLWECPTEAISPGEIRPIVDSNRCTECYGFFGESQCMVVCPVDAIEIDRLEPLEVLANRYARLNPERQAEDTFIWQRKERPR